VCLAFFHPLSVRRRFRLFSTTLAGKDPSQLTVIAVTDLLPVPGPLFAKFRN
jgi:hypothetical protein